MPSVSVDGDELILTLNREFQFYKSDGNTPFLITIANYKGRSKTIFSRKNKTPQSGEPEPESSGSESGSEARSSRMSAR